MGKDKNYIIRKIRTEDVLGLHKVYFLTWLDTYPNEEFNITTEDIVYKYKLAGTPNTRHFLYGLLN